MNGTPSPQAIRGTLADGLGGAVGRGASFTLATVIATALMVLFPTLAEGQDELAFTLENHLAPVGPSDGVFVATPTPLPRHAVHLQLRTDYANRPVGVQFRGGGTQAAHLIAHRLGGTLSLAFGIADEATLYVSFPFVLHQEGEGVLGVAAPDPRGAGDLVLGLNARLFGDSDGFSLGLGLALIEPTGSVDAFASDGRTSAQAALRAAHRTGSWTVAGSLGVSLRPEREWLTHTTGIDLLMTLGLFIDATDSARFGLELAAASGLAKASFGSRGRSPMEVNASGRFHIVPSLYVQVGAGLGLVRGVGNPRARATLALGWLTDRER